MYIQTTYSTICASIGGFNTYSTINAKAYKYTYSVN